VSSKTGVFDLLAVIRPDVGETGLSGISREGGREVGR